MKIKVVLQVLQRLNARIVGRCDLLRLDNTHKAYQRYVLSVQRGGTIDLTDNNRFTKGLNPNFKNAKRLYFDNIKLPGFANDIPQQDPDSKYARAARLGLCFKCLREDENPDHRPRHVMLPYCKECNENFAIGTEKLVIRAEREVSRWFGNEGRPT